jgi:hypothetical protein
VADLLAALPTIEWAGFAPTVRRAERRLFVSAGMSLQQMDVVVDLE